MSARWPRASTCRCIHIVERVAYRSLTYLSDRPIPIKLDLWRHVHEQHPELQSSGNELLDEYVLLNVIESFAVEFIKGFVNLMLELGYDSAMEHL